MAKTDLYKTEIINMIKKYEDGQEINLLDYVDKVDFIDEYGTIEQKLFSTKVKNYFKMIENIDFNWSKYSELSVKRELNYIKLYNSLLDEIYLKMYTGYDYAVLLVLLESKIGWSQSEIILRLTLDNAVCMTVKTLERSLKKLIAEGFIYQEKRDRVTKQYRISDVVLPWDEESAEYFKINKQVLALLSEKVISKTDFEVYLGIVLYKGKPDSEIITNLVELLGTRKQHILDSVLKLRKLGLLSSNK